MSLKKQLTILHGLPLAIGSIIGSGILFLPSIIFAMSGKNIFYVWTLMTIICIPLLEIFTDMVKHVPESSGIKGFISLGLGENIGATIPIIFLGTVGIGMPTAAIIAGNYLSQLLHTSYWVTWLAAFVMVYIGILTNLFNIKISVMIQSIITILLFLVGFGLVFINIHSIAFSFPTFISTFNSNLVLHGMLLAMWAFAGFENLTFIAGEFKHPARDFRICSYVALFVCGLLYLGLSLAYAVTTQHSSMQNVSSLYDLALNIHPQVLATFCIVLFAIICVQINTNSWIFGIARLVYSSAIQKNLPSYFSQLNHKNLPARAIYLLAIIYGIVFFVYAIYPDLLKMAIQLGSCNFLFIYILTLFSYIKFKQSGWLKVSAFFLLCILLLIFLHGGWVVLYPIFLFCISFFVLNLSILCRLILRKRLKEY